MVYQVIGDPTFEERQVRFDFIAERRNRKPPVSYETIAVELARVEGIPEEDRLSRQAIHKIWSRQTVRPNGRPANPVKKRADIEGRILQAHTRRLAVLSSGKSKDDPAVARLDSRIERLQEQLLTVK